MLRSGVYITFHRVYITVSACSMRTCSQTLQGLSGQYLPPGVGCSSSLLLPPRLAQYVLAARDTNKNVCVSPGLATTAAVSRGHGAEAPVRSSLPAPSSAMQSNTPSLCGKNRISNRNSGAMADTAGDRNCRQKRLSLESPPINTGRSTPTERTRNSTLTIQN